MTTFAAKKLAMSKTLPFHIRTWHILALILLVGLLFRMYDLETKGLWMDEIHSAVAADPGWSYPELLAYAEKDQPPVFFIILHEWYKLTSYSDFSGRLLSVIFGLFGIIAMFFLGREIKDQRVGLLAAFFTSINYFHIDHSREVRFYPFLFLFALLSYLFFIRCLKIKKNIDFFWYTFFTALLLNTHYFGIVVFLSQSLLFLVFLIWKKITDIKFILKGVVSGIVAGLSLAHWLPVIIGDIGITHFHIQPIRWYFLVQYFYMYFRDPVTCVVVGLFILIALRELMTRYKSRGFIIEDFVLVGWICLGYFIPLAYSILQLPMLQDKYTFIVVPGILMLAALGFDQLADKRWSLYLLSLLFLCILINSFFIKRLYHIKYPPEQWREVAQEIVKSDKDTQLVFSEYAWYYRYYFKVYKSVNLPLEPAYANFNGLIVNANSVWVIISTKLSDRGLSEAQQKKLDQQFKLERTETFIDSRAIRYIRK